MVGSNLLSTGVVIGTRLPAYATSSGLAMMAMLPEPEAKRLLKASELKAFTPNTVYEPAKIMERLKQARTKGYVLSVGDYFPNDISLGAAIMSRRGHVQGAVSLSVAIDRYAAKDAEAKFARLVSTAAKSILV